MKLMKYDLALFTLIVILFSHIQVANNLALELHNHNQFDKSINNLRNSKTDLSFPLNENYEVKMLPNDLNSPKIKKEIKSIDGNTNIPDKQNLIINVIENSNKNDKKGTLYKKSKKSEEEKSSIKIIKSKSDLNLSYPTSPIDQWQRGNCFTLIDNNLYDLYPLREKLLNLLSIDGYIVDFTLCKDLVSDTGSRAMVINNSKGTRFSDRFIIDKYWASENGKLYLQLPEGDACNNEETENYQTTIILKCNPSMDDPVIRNSDDSNDAFDKNNCKNYIKIETKYACSIGSYVFWYKSFGFDEGTLGLIMILFGLAFILFGEKFTRVSSCIIVAISMGIIIKAVTGIVVDIDLKLCLASGASFAFLVLFNQNLRNNLLALILGFLIGNISYDFVIQIIYIDPFILYWLSIATSVAVMLIFTAIIEDRIVIILSAFFGSYALVRGISLHIGGFPEETYTSKLIMYGEFNQLSKMMNKTVELYLASIGGVFLAGCIFQGVIKSPLNKDDEK